MTEVTSLMTQSHQESRSFIEEFESLQDPDVLAKKLGFWKHPEYQELVANDEKRRAKRQVASVIMYSLDSGSQHAQLQALKQKRESKRKQKDKVVREFQQPKQKKVALSDAVEEKAIIEHLHSFLSDAPGKVMLSVPATSPVALRNLDARLSMSASASQQAPVLAIEDGVQGQAPNPCMNLQKQISCSSRLFLCALIVRDSCPCLPLQVEDFPTKSCV